MLLGVTGNSGCGQTTFAAELARCGAGVCSLDNVGHRLLKRPRVAREVGDVLELPGLSDQAPAAIRRRVGERVFGQPEMLRALNSLVHPMMRRWAHLSAARLGGRPGLFVLEGALILELDLAVLLDHLVVVEDTLERCQHRLAARDGADPETVRARWRAQWSLERKRACADAVVRNSGGRQELREQARALYRRLRRM
jgi:dephospho-CoA kinase